MIYKAVDTFSAMEFKVTDQGYLVAPGNIARIGIQEYLASELGIDAAPGTRLKLYRPPEEVFDQASMSSFENAPVTIGHPDEWVNSANWSKLAKGEAVNVDKAGDTFLKANIVVKSQDAINYIKQGNKQLSNGYTFKLDLNSGKTPHGLDYDGIQREIRGNHVAIVNQARCGSACRIFDSEPSKQKGGPMAERKIVVDGIPLEVSDAAAAVIEKLQNQIKTSNSTIADLQSKVGESVTIKVGDVSKTYTGDQVIQELKAKDDEIALLKTQIMTPEQRDAMVADWSQLLAGAEKLVPGFVTSGKDCETIRKQVLAEVIKAGDKRAELVKAVVPDVDKASSDSLKSGFAVAVTATESVKSNDGQFFTNTDKSTGDKEPELIGRDKFMAQSMNAWQAKQ